MKKVLFLLLVIVLFTDADWWDVEEGEEDAGVRETWLTS